MKDLQALFGEILQIDEIQPFHLQGIDYITELCNDQNYYGFFNQRIDQSIVRILKSANSKVVDMVVNIILNSIIGGMKCFDNYKPYLLPGALERDGIVNALYEDVLIKEGVSEKNKNLAAISIGRLYEKTELPQLYTNAVILQMKKGMKSEIKDISMNSLSILSSLVQKKE
ncbi:MAG: hypothetical protein EZS28_029086 [Streblomastix strix]|uniref:Uncharacterized protein n=1 Tax=Streblomastix strix TaxID=222440 RepID=A0A5J4UYE9_9EUKA|nr:MAG: hypothetical protein EZS28_029086 [Streblomastix strix]